MCEKAEIEEKAGRVETERNWVRREKVDKEV